MGLIRSFLDRFWGRDEYFEEDELLWDEEDFWQEERSLNKEKESTDTKQDLKTEEEWDWDTITDERSFLKLSDSYQRGKYIRSLVEQVKNASGELDKLSFEYNVVTAALKDMDELDALPVTEKEKVTEYAKKILYYEKERQDYQNKKSKITESQYYSMEQYEENADKIYEDMRKAEKYRELIRDDLNRLEGEKQAYQYRKGEYSHGITNSRGMAMICLLAMGLLGIMLAIMQFGFGMEVTLGYFMTIIAGAVALTVIYVHYLDQAKDLKRAEKGVNRIILLQNTVKIRYVNNRNLLDYLYLKYNVKSAKEWKRLCDLYEEEKRAREMNEQNEEDLDYYQAELLKILRCYQLSDPRLWVRCPLALYDHKEMVEIRHAHIIRRQKLRAQMDYNKRMAKEGEKELRSLIAEYPQYSREILKMMERYE